MHLYHIIFKYLTGEIFDQFDALLLNIHQNFMCQMSNNYTSWDYIIYILALKMFTLYTVNIVMSVHVANYIMHDLMNALSMH